MRVYPGGPTTAETLLAPPYSRKTYVCLFWRVMHLWRVGQTFTCVSGGSRHDRTSKQWHKLGIITYILVNGEWFDVSCSFVRPAETRKLICSNMKVAHMFLSHHTLHKFSESLTFCEFCDCWRSCISSGNLMGHTSEQQLSFLAHLA